MARFLGNSSLLGVFEKQVIIPNDIDNEFLLQFKVGSANSLLVVYAGQLQEPNVDYDITEGGRKISFNFVPSSAFNLYVQYLGRELSIPANLGARPIRDEFDGDGTQTTFQLSPPHPAHEEGMVVFVDGVYQQNNVDWTVDITTNQITFATPPPPGTANIQVHIFGLERNDLVTVDELAITTNKLANNSVTAEKLNLKPEPYIPQLTTFAGMNNSSTVFHEAEFLDKGIITELSLHFTTNLSGTPDNKLRVSLPIALASNTINLAGVVNLSSPTNLETGMIRWGSNTAIDIYRQFGVNYTLEEWVVEVKLNYKTVA